MSTANALIEVEELAAALRSVAAQGTTTGSVAASGTAASGPAAEGPAARLVIVDVRWRLGGPPPAELYAAGHLPGAVGVDLDSDLAAPVGDGRRGRHPLPEPEALQAALHRWGIRADSSVWPTTTPTAPAPPGPGGCCAGPDWRTGGCSTVGSPPGPLPDCP